MLNKLIENLNIKRLLIITIAVFIAGYIVHGQIIFNKYIYHDEVSAINGYFGTLSFGRWAIYFILNFLKSFFIITSTNSFSAFYVFLFVSLSVYILIEIYNVNDYLSIILLSILSINNLSITMVFGYMFISVYYAFSIFLTALSAYILLGENSINYKIFASIVLCVAVGIYQSVIVLYFNILAFYLIFNVKKLKLNYIALFIPAIISVIFYLIMYKSYLALKNVEVTTYKGIGTLGYNGLGEYFVRLKEAFINFFIHSSSSSFSMFPGKIGAYYTALIIVMCVIFCVYILTVKNIFFSERIIIIVIFFLTPFIVNGMFIIAGAKNVSSMNLFNYILIFLLIFKLFEELKFYEIIKPYVYIKNIAIVLILLITILLFKYIDTCYSNLFFNVEREKSFGINLISKIQNIEGYNDEFGLCFVENPNPYFHRIDQNFDKDQPYSDIVITPPFAENNPYNSYVDYEFNKIVNGFNPKRISYKDFGHYDEIDLMPIYPDDGSIKIIDNVIVIKMESVEK